MLNKTQSRSPSLIGTLVADSLVKRRGAGHGKLFKYEKVCADYGVLLLSRATQNKTLLTKMILTAAPVLAGDIKPKSGHVDNNVYGIVSLELYLQTRIDDYLKIGKYLADQQYAHTLPDGLTDQARFWVDDMWKICSLRSQTYRATHESKYLDRVIEVILAYAKRLQSTSGLFYHTENSHFFWGRGNGWAAAPLAITLLSAEHQTKREDIVKIYRKTMAAIVEFQGGSGLWHQLVDVEDSFEETSCSGMFVYALASGVTNGWLNSEKYRRAAIRGWNALCQQVDKNGNVFNVCIETEDGYNANYYRARPVRTDDLHGQAGILWAASAMLHLERTV